MDTLWNLSSTDTYFLLPEVPSALNTGGQAGLLYRDELLAPTPGSPLLPFASSAASLSDLSEAAIAATENLTSTEDEPIVIPYSQRLAPIIVPIVFAIIFFVGLFGNGTLALIFVRHRVIRNVPNTYILSLALGDLLVITSSVPFTSTVYTFESWPYGELLCKISESTKDVSIGVTVFTLTALSADRFFAIVDPLKKLHSSIGGRRATKFTVLMTVIIWGFSLICAAPAAVFSYIRVFEAENVTLFEVCYPYPERWMPYYAKCMVMARFLIYYVIPLTVIGCFYVLMARHLIHSTRNLPGEAQGQIRQIRARRKVAKTVLAFVVIFAVCFLPTHLFALWFYYYPNAQSNFDEAWNIFRMVGFCLSFSNSCVNPIALYFVSGTFRKYFDEYLLYMWCRMGGRRNRYDSATERSNRCCAGSRGCAGVRAKSIGNGSTANGAKILMKAASSSGASVPGAGMRKDRIIWETTTATQPPAMASALQMSILKNTDAILTTECTVTTLLNSDEAKNQLI